MRIGCCFKAGGPLATSNITCIKGLDQISMCAMKGSPIAGASIESTACDKRGGFGLKPQISMVSVSNEV
jgi:hypothetical protein